MTASLQSAEASFADHQSALVISFCHRRDSNLAVVEAKRQYKTAVAGERADIIHQLAEPGIDFATVAAQAVQPDADQFDTLCYAILI